MGDSTAIRWTDATWGPVTGCSKVSAGCQHCYAETLALGRLAGRPGYPGLPWTAANAPANVTLRPDRLHQPIGWRAPRRIFVNSMSDLFHELVPEAFLLAVFAVMEAAPQHTYQVLTKRPERMAAFLGRGRTSEPPRARSAAPFLPIPGFPDYEAGQDGVIYSSQRGARRPLSPDPGDLGHARVTLYRDRERIRVSVHRLVLAAFDRPGREDEQARHLNGDATDNRPHNLAWGSQADNWTDRIRHGNEQAISTLTWRKVADLRIAALRGETVRALADRFGVTTGTVNSVVAGTTWAPRPRPWIWLGTSIELDRWVGRADALRATPAGVRFISAEPLLGPLPSLDLTAIDWLIIGGESGPGHRPMEMEWARDLRDRACASGTAVFFKQDSGSRTELRPYIVEPDGSHTVIEEYPAVHPLLGQGRLGL